mmetsp:Transcript_7909/g.22001  ORF Transcript_7909/g.22001 Transcript_7909/m.22001 type:complete len:275 (-) Transcript_7909:2141-2965(-)
MATTGMLPQSSQAGSEPLSLHVKVEERSATWYDRHRSQSFFEEGGIRSNQGIEQYLVGGNEAHKDSLRIRHQVQILSLAIGRCQHRYRYRHNSSIAILFVGFALGFVAVAIFAAGTLGRLLWHCNTIDHEECFDGGQKSSEDASNAVLKLLPSVTGGSVFARSRIAMAAVILESGAHAFAPISTATPVRRIVRIPVAIIGLIRFLLEIDTLKDRYQTEAGGEFVPERHETRALHECYQLGTGNKKTYRFLGIALRFCRESGQCLEDAKKLRFGR